MECGVKGAGGEGEVGTCEGQVWCVFSVYEEGWCWEMEGSVVGVGRVPTVEVGNVGMG